ncbi:hypothetical protein CYY_001996 [Polysphondylium violaceum]|uniref:SAP domain-containing protein n=1 Tax=Polysphondylium violaceum TaxID=133409 RepID=A0A8J4PXF6_9MYCE|nr:hypothetical protein CYY_001996 [Polysphondylium violaceum]
MQVPLNFAFYLGSLVSAQLNFLIGSYGMSLTKKLVIIVTAILFISAYLFNKDVFHVINGTNGGVGPHNYMYGESVVLYFNNLVPYNSPTMIYSFHFIPWCMANISGPIPINYKQLDLVDSFVYKNTKLYDSGLPFLFATSIEDEFICNTTIENQYQRNLFIYAIQNQFILNTYLDKLSTINRIGEVIYDFDSHPNRKLYTLFKHFKFMISFNQQNIVRVNIVPEKPEVIDIRHTKPTTISFSYSVEWSPSLERFEDRDNRYRADSNETLEIVSILGSLIGLSLLSIIIVFVHFKLRDKRSSPSSLSFSSLSSSSSYDNTDIDLEFDSYNSNSSNGIQSTTATISITHIKYIEFHSAFVGVGLQLFFVFCMIIVCNFIYSKQTKQKQILDIIVKGIPSTSILNGILSSFILFSRMNNPMKILRNPTKIHQYQSLLCCCFSSFLLPALFTFYLLIVFLVSTSNLYSFNILLERAIIFKIYSVFFFVTVPLSMLGFYLGMKPRVFSFLSTLLHCNNNNENNSSNNNNNSSIYDIDNGNGGGGNQHIIKRIITIIQLIICVLVAGIIPYLPIILYVDTMFYNLFTFKSGVLNRWYSLELVAFIFISVMSNITSTSISNNNNISLNSIDETELSKYTILKIKDILKSKGVSFKQSLRKPDLIILLKDTLINENNKISQYLENSKTTNLNNNNSNNNDNTFKGQFFSYEESKVLSNTSQDSKDLLLSTQVIEKELLDQQFKQYTTRDSNRFVIASDYFTVLASLLKDDLLKGGNRAEQVFLFMETNNSATKGFYNILLFYLKHYGPEKAVKFFIDNIQHKSEFLYKDTFIHFFSNLSKEESSIESVEKLINYVESHYPESTRDLENNYIYMHNYFASRIHTDLVDNTEKYFSIIENVLKSSSPSSSSSSSNNNISNLTQQSREANYIRNYLPAISQFIKYCLKFNPIKALHYTKLINLYVRFDLKWDQLEKVYMSVKNQADLEHLYKLHQRKNSVYLALYQLMVGNHEYLAKLKSVLAPIYQKEWTTWIFDYCTKLNRFDKALEWYCVFVGGSPSSSKSFTVNQYYIDSCKTKLLFKSDLQIKPSPHKRPVYPIKSDVTIAFSSAAKKYLYLPDDSSSSSINIENNVYQREYNFCLQVENYWITPNTSNRKNFDRLPHITKYQLGTRLREIADHFRNSQEFDLNRQHDLVLHELIYGKDIDQLWNYLNETYLSKSLFPPDDQLLLAFDKLKKQKIVRDFEPKDYISQTPQQQPITPISYISQIPKLYQTLLNPINKMDVLNNNSNINNSKNNKSNNNNNNNYNNISNDDIINFNSTIISNDRNDGNKNFLKNKNKNFKKNPNYKTK